MRKQMRAVMEEFPCLARAIWDGEAPYQLAIEATHAVRGSAVWAFFNRTSYSLIPSSDESEIELIAAVARGDRRLAVYEATGTYRTKRHLFWVLLPPAWKRQVPRRTAEDTFRDLFLQIQQDAGKLFESGVPAAADE